MGGSNNSTQGSTASAASYTAVLRLLSSSRNLSGNRMDFSRPRSAAQHRLSPASWLKVPSTTIKVGRSHVQVSKSCCSKKRSKAWDVAKPASHAPATRSQRAMAKRVLPIPWAPSTLRNSKFGVEPSPTNLSKSSSSASRSANEMQPLQGWSNGVPPPGAEAHGATRLKLRPGPRPTRLVLT